jgi:hypothetical protein
MRMPREYHREYSREYYHKCKKELICQLGGKCVKCGELENLQFDHINPDDKSFDIGKLLNYSKERVKEELIKCQLLCKRCHDKKSLNEGSFKKNKGLGDTAHNTVLNEAQVKVVKGKLLLGISMAEISRECGIRYESVKTIKYGTAWKHVKIDLT